MATTTSRTALTKSIRTLNNGNYATQTLQNQVTGALGAITAQPILDGTLISGLSVVANTQVNIVHNLGRAYKGYFVTRTQGNNVVLVREVTGTILDLTKFLPLVPSSTATIDLWIF